MKNPLYIFTRIAPWLLISCGNERPIPSSQLPEYTDQLIVNSVLSNTENISIYVGKSANAYSDSVPTRYDNVDVQLVANGNTVSVQYDNNTNRFVANRKPVPGQSYEVTVTDNAGVLSTTNARSRMPEEPVSKSVRYVENGAVDINGNPSDLLSLTWTDVSGNNYYIAHFYYYSEVADLYLPFDFAMTDETLSHPETVELNDGGYLFNDKLFNGREKTISVVPPGGLVAGNSDVLYLIELQTVTSDYYQYITTLQKFRDQQDFQESGPFGSAVIVHSNINNGLGVFLTTTLASDTIR